MNKFLLLTSFTLKLIWRSDFRIQWCFWEWKIMINLILKIKCLTPSLHTLISSLKVTFQKNNIKLKDLAQEILHCLVCQNLFYEGEKFNGCRMIRAKDNSAKKTLILFYAIFFVQVYCNLYHTIVWLCYNCTIQFFNFCVNL